MQSVFGPTVEVVDEELILLIEKIPYHTWGWAINTATGELINLIAWANYSTIIAMGAKFLSMQDSFWKSTKDKDFRGIGEAMEERLIQLWYIVTSRDQRTYNSNWADTESTLIFPIQAKKQQ